ncbi:MAG: DnaJ domain-containing protein [Anaerolineae bacterium]|nr:DnaJ domain-containing protein [Anaerolineae bacterium]MDW8067871.1 DnaJ domain-containing protein [Anaerolineae bacterium]
MREGEKDLYAILGVSPLATQEEIRHAYRKLVRRFHPDSGSEEASAERFQEVQEAYQVLGDIARRQAYDRRRAERGESPTTALAWDILVSRQQLLALPEEQMLYLLVDLKPSGQTTFKRIPLNLCLVIDQSTSMDGDRLDHVKVAAHQIVDELTKEDIVGVVAFNDRATIMHPSQALTEPLRVHARISSIWAGGGTEIFQGLRAGLEEVRRFHRKGEMLSHVILLTDGRTYGDEEHCLAEARRAAAEGIEITVLGIGEDWNDVFLDRLARQTGGTSAYIAYPQQVRGVMRDLIQRLSMLLARNVTLTVRSTERAWVENAFRAAPFIERLSAEGGVYTLGNLLAGRPMQVLLEIVVQEPTPGFHRLAQLEMNAEIPSFHRQERLIFDLEREFVSEEVEEPVSPILVNVLSRLSIFRMQEQVWKALDTGRTEEARQRLETIATRLLDMGEAELAHVALLEAGRIAQGGQMSSKGEKVIRYGTRGLGLKEGREWE